MKIDNIVSFQIWKDRYRKGEETLNDNIVRVADYCSNSQEEFEAFMEVMNLTHFLPAGRTMSNAGIGNKLTLNNCFNANHVEDSIDNIFDKVKLGAITHKAGGGIGYDFSKIRPNGTPTSNDAIASGVVSFMNVFNSQTATILQGGRRGANMSVLSIYHPDIFEYIDAKSYDEGRLQHFNMSIMIDDDFMIAVQNDQNIFLHFPVYDEIGHIIKDESKWQIKKEVNARELYNLIIRKAYETGENGVLFYDNMNKDNNVYYMETLISTNPCGEYVSGLIFGEHPITREIINPEDYKGACNLGSIFLHKFVKHPFTDKAELDYDALRFAIHTGVRFLDNIIDINVFPNYAYENYQKNLRTIGLGHTGLGDMLAMLNMKYGSKESVEYIDELMNFFAKETYRASIELAKEKGSFPMLDRAKFVKSGFLTKHVAKDRAWLGIIADILKYGIRNARCLSVAPTGTLSLAYGENCSSGLEPIIALEGKRKVKMGGQSEDNIQIIDFRDYAYDLWLKTENKIVTKDVFVTIADLGVMEHLEILKTVAFHIDMSCSKTINLPSDYSFEDTLKVYEYCWENGIKGCTIFRPNEVRQGIFITEETKKELEETPLKRGEWADLSDDIIYYKRKIYIGCGKINLFIGYSPSKHKIEDMYVIRSGHGGCERNLQGMVIAMSGMLRLGGDIFNIEKAFEGVGGCNSFVSQRMKGEKLSKGSSCGTAILNEIKTFLNNVGTIEGTIKVVETIQPLTINPIAINNEELKFTDEEQKFLKTNGEIAFVSHFKKCPQCGEPIRNQEGCYSCVCGFSKCS